MNQRWILFGGAGFIGRHLARHLIQTGTARHVVLADIAFAAAGEAPPWYQAALDAGILEQQSIDVRNPIARDALPADADVVVNLAAVHREPGHQPAEYFVTNVTGAENIVRWLETTSCGRAVFVSSISVYGDTRAGVSEDSLPMPQTPYGISKLLAEKTFERWAARAPRRRLVILRPAVVFGEGERGNVTRLVRALARGRFVYVGGSSVRKAGGYVKEFPYVLAWLLERSAARADQCLIANFALPQAPPLSEYVEAIQRVRNARFHIRTVPFRLAWLAAAAISALARLAGRTSSIHPRRIEKLTWATDVRAEYLAANGYRYRYTLADALSDWRNDSPQEWSQT